MRAGLGLGQGEWKGRKERTHTLQGSLTPLGCPKQARTQMVPGELAPAPPQPWHV